MKGYKQVFRLLVMSRAA